MGLALKGCGALVLRLIVGLALLGWPRAGSAQGTWSVISLPQKPGEVVAPTALATDAAGALAADAAGSLYVADSPYDPATGTYSRIQKRDARGTWALIATNGAGLGQVSFPTALAVDTAGNLYIAERSSGNNRVQKRDVQ